jgi:hypothetical protein
MPRSLMSAESSGGVRSSAMRIALTIVETDSLNASRISLSFTVTVLGHTLDETPSLDLHGQRFAQGIRRANLDLDLLRRALPDQKVVFSLQVIRDGFIHVIAGDAQRVRIDDAGQIQKAQQRKTLVHPRIVISVPSEITQVEKRAVAESAYRAKAADVHLVEQAMMAAIGAGLPVTEPGGNFVVDIGGGTTDVAVMK